jgi:HSP20 family protein
MVFPNPSSGRLMDELATDVGTLVESLFGEVTDPGRVQKRSRMTASMDIDENDQAYLVTLDVPGVALESIEINVHEDTLTITGQRGSAESAGSEGGAADESRASEPVMKPLRRERAVGKFERKVQLTLPVEADAVTAKLADGVLVVSLPKADPEKGKRRVPISKGN